MIDPCPRTRTRPAALAAAAVLLLPAVALEARAQMVQAGYEVPFEAESPHPYPTGRGKEPVWTAKIEHPGATYIAVHFDRRAHNPILRQAALDADGLRIPWAGDLPVRFTFAGVNV